MLVLRRTGGENRLERQPRTSPSSSATRGSFTCTDVFRQPAFEAVRGRPKGLRAEAEASPNLQGRFPPKLSKASVIPADQLSSRVVADLVETAPEDADALWPT